MTLTEFLLARIAEDEAIAREATPEPWVDGEGYVHTDQVGDQVTDFGSTDEAQGRRDSAHIARHDPARVLAECEAKRRIVEAALEVLGDLELGEDPLADADDLADGQVWAFAEALRLLASVYADHPDYDEAWRA